ncbi:MAG: TolC family protein [Candidatus Eremiobacteraeota bacterium]|nr:TolC family protein [Candidatus Eremiobacteraeota bacterium]
MFYLLALMLAATASLPAVPAAAPSAQATGTPAPIATARPSGIATPNSSKGLVLPPVPNVEPGFHASQQSLPSADIAGVTGPFVGVALDDAVSMALARNTDLAVSQSNRRIAAFQIVAAKGAYDTNFQLQPQYEVQVEPPLSPLQSGPNGGPITQINAGAQAGFGGNTTTGGTYRVFTSAQRVNSNFIYNGYDPYYETALGFQFTQPLARNRAIDVNRRQLSLARVNADLSDDNAALQASNTIDNVLDAYYNLVAAWKNVAIQEDAVRQAEAQSESNGRLVRRGAAAAVDVVESDTQVNEFQNDVYSAIQNVASQQNVLKQLLLGNPADPLWTANLVPTTPISEEVDEPAIDAVILSALKQRPEVAQLRENMREENVNVAFARDQTKPQIDLNLSVTENGFAGNPVNLNNTPLFSVITNEVTTINQLVALSNAANPGSPLAPINASAFNTPLFPFTNGNVGQSYGTALKGEFPTYQILATLSFPLRNREAKANYAAETERQAQLLTQEVALIQRLQYEARNAVQTYRSARSRLIATTAARIAAEKVAASELRKFRAGASTTFLVLQRQVSLANERGQELQAQSDVQKALVEIGRVSGDILRDNGVNVKTVGTGISKPLLDLGAGGHDPLKNP